MSYVERETARSTAHSTKAGAGEYVVFFRRAILATAMVVAISFQMISGAPAQQRNERAYAEESPPELRKDNEQQRNLRALDLDLHGSRQESDRSSSKPDPQEQRLCDTAPDFCPNFHGDSD
jgi:hypothetical protein